MPEFLNTEDISARLVAIISDAREFLCLISPYLSVNDRLKQRIEAKASSEVSVHIIYRHQEQNPDVNAWLKSLPSVSTSFCENLHAKCYMNEKEAILTSMNLYEYSQSNNNEMGILISYQLLGNDNDVYKDIYKEVHRLVTISSPEATAMGFCIRCKKDVPFNPTKPYCDRHLKIWNKFKNEKFKEKYCHTCAKEHPTTMEKPVCLTC